MFLKSIEIRGFKSFADKTELMFKKGITAVVGPNGSGKSNISDAVRWVLGEQSVKTLRGDKMEDVIFAGTQFRKPVGLAQVSLILDNSDAELDVEYSEVVISRRLYRSGESEYLINNTICRLKDVQNLFMDTGIGKEGYSIIGQGKIDAILSGKPEERRKLLEEAAGIVKYKTRKEESERKLENTNQNLIRIDDILGTYEERLEPLKSESDKANKFLELSKQLKANEINIIIDFIEKNYIKISSYKSQCEIINKELQGKINKRRILKTKLEENSLKLEEFESKISKDKQKFYDNKSKHQQVLSEIKILEERIEIIKSSISKIDDEKLTLIDKVRNLEENIKELEIALKDFLNSHEDLKEKIKSNEKLVEEIYNNNLKENSRLKEIENIKNSLHMKKNDEGNNIIILNNNIDGIEQKLESIKTEIEGIRNSVKINETTKAILNEEGIKILKKIDDYNNEIKENKISIGKLRHNQTLEEKKLRELLATSNKVDANLNMLINLEKQYEGYNKSVKTLMQHIDNNRVGSFKGKCYILGEIIKVDKKFETSMEIALGSSLSNIITEDENGAKILIEYLKKHSLGRATFLPLNTVKGRVIELGNNIKSMNGFIGIASEILSYDSKFKGIIDYALGRTVICDNMDNAIKIARALNYRQKIVTLSGEVINPGGALTGGSIYNKSNNIIGRKREIEELKIRFDVLNKEVKEKNILLKNLNEQIKELDEENLNLRDYVHFENIEKTKINEKINSLKDDTIRLKSSLNENEKNLGAKEVERKKLVEEIKILEENFKSMDSEINKLEIEENSLREKITESEASVEKYKDILTELKIKKAKIDEIVINRENDIKRIKNEINVLREKQENVQKEVISLQTNKKNYEEILKNNKHSVKDIITEIENMEKFIEDSQLEKIKIKDEINKIRSQEEDISLELENTEKELHKYQVTLAKIETEKENLLSKLNEEFNLTYAEALDFKEPITNISKVKEEALFIKEEIRNLGTVNVGSIEEYKEVKEKYTFMVSQKEDLVDAKNELIKVIDEMTAKMREVFKENFIKLRKNFNETFKQLFKGGSADLILKDGDELTSKIEINVEPPGKKLQNINLLSGGEKVLSAIALLFAILKMKPTPFCILDEIEAALDDANVIRYAEFLKKFSTNIQFIVITHRKGTMEASDMLYGVTMEEKGVSKVVSVDFTR
ncbi:chromosome segregation protein SMC [Clostridium sp. ATCC 25772]|uniref:chromosome segregation protein SMC n=1 Tax=Clostridium sp. ATCC 25772 TaxID=1676991 RepID=UPI0007834108|nr:chromosome segregation protein SMC [Clostridium sp. ATCC 25772]